MLTFTVRCANTHVQTSTLADMTAYQGSAKDAQGNTVPLPFVNQKRRFKVRIKNFYPPDLIDFAQYLDPPTQPSESTQSVSEPVFSPRNWQWDFFLEIEDASTPRSLSAGGSADEAPKSMWVHVRDDNAQFLLKLDAVDLRKDGKMLHQLREKLFLLWGNVEEIVTGQAGEGVEASNQPFECCVAEYGVEVDVQDRRVRGQREWIRVFEMFGVTID